MSRWREKNNDRTSLGNIQDEGGRGDIQQIIYPCILFTICGFVAIYDGLPNIYANIPLHACMDAFGNKHPFFASPAYVAEFSLTE